MIVFDVTARTIESWSDDHRLHSQALGIKWTSPPSGWFESQQDRRPTEHPRPLEFNEDNNVKDLSEENGTSVQSTLCVTWPHSYSPCLRHLSFLRITRFRTIQVIIAISSNLSRQTTTSSRSIETVIHRIQLGENFLTGHWQAFRKEAAMVVQPVLQKVFELLHLVDTGKNPFIHTRHLLKLIEMQGLQMATTDFWKACYRCRRQRNPVPGVSVEICTVCISWFWESYR